MAGELALNPPAVQVIDGEVVDETAELIKSVPNRLLASLCDELAAISVIGIRPFEYMSDWANDLSAEAKWTPMHVDSVRLKELPA